MKQKIRILYVITQGEWGGAQRYVFDLATHLNNDFKITIAIGESKGKNDLQSKIQNPESRIKIIGLHHLKRAISPIHDILAIFELRRLYKTLQPNVVHLNSSKAGIVGSLAKSSIFNLESSIMYTVHGWVFNEPTRKLGRFLYRLLERWTAKWKDKIIILSNNDLEAGIELGINKNKFVKIPLAIEPQIFLDKKIAREKLSTVSGFQQKVAGQPRCFMQFPISNFIVGTIANLYPSKGIDILIEAINIINQKSVIPEKASDPRGFTGKNLQFIVIGEGLERKKLESQIIKHKINNVYLVGSLENASQYLKAFDLFVLPSRKEGFPYTLLEALAADIPIIATSVGGISTILPKNEKIQVIKPLDANALSHAISHAVNNKQKINNGQASPYPSFPLDEMIAKTCTLYSSFTVKKNLLK